MGYDDIRAALGHSFSVASLNIMTKLGHDLLGADAPLRHPAAAYTLATTAQNIAWYWDGAPLPEDAVAAVEAHLRPKMLAVLDAAESEAQTLLSALDDLARAYTDAIPFLRQSP